MKKKQNKLIRFLKDKECDSLVKESIKKKIKDIEENKEILK